MAVVVMVCLTWLKEYNKIGRAITALAHCPDLLCPNFSTVHIPVTASCS